MVKKNKKIIIIIKRYTILIDNKPEIKKINLCITIKNYKYIHI